MSLPCWARARLGLDRICRTEFDPDPFIDDIHDLIGRSLPSDVAELAEVSTTASSIEVLFERRSGQALLLWDTDFTNRLDGVLALLFCTDREDDDGSFQGMGIAAYADLTASIYLKQDPAVARFILRLTDEFMPDSISVTVDDDIRMDRYRRLIRAYIALHELAHILYRIVPDMIPKIDELIQRTIANIRPSQMARHDLIPSPVDAELEERGFLVKPRELDDVIAQIHTHLRRPKDYEEIWCDVAASEYLLDWAEENGFTPQECVVADDLLHLVLAGRIQWTTFWDRRNDVPDWSQSPLLGNHENRSNIRGLLMASNASREWAANNAHLPANEASTAFADLVASEGDALKKRFFDRSHLALGILGGLDRNDMFSRADGDWAQLGAEQRAVIIAEMFDFLS